MKKIWIALIKLFGWKFDIPDLAKRPELRHSVLIEAPHTSALDFLIGAACVWKMDLNARFFIKKEFFVFPIKGFLRRSGAIAIDRGNKANHIVDKAVESLNQHSDLTIIITPEGTRKKTRRFKRGFYDIAVQANVPIVLTYINYKERRMGVGPSFTPSGNFDSDMLQILDFYTSASPRNSDGWDIGLLKQNYMAKKTTSTNNTL